MTDSQKKPRRYYDIISSFFLSERLLVDLIVIHYPSKYLINKFRSIVFCHSELTRLSTQKHFQFPIDVSKLFHYFPKTHTTDYGGKQKGLFEVA